jgi:hypothetical protein
VNRSNHLPVNFALALPARRALERLRSEIDERYPEDPVAVLSVAWGYAPGVDPLSGNVVVGFYPRSLLADVAQGIHEVSGVRLVFAASEEFHPLFAGKVVDHEEGRGFFLRDP